MANVGPGPIQFHGGVFENIVNVQWNDTAIEFPPGSRVTNQSIQDTNKLTIVMVVRIPADVLTAKGQIPILEFGSPTHNVTNTVDSPECNDADSPSRINLSRVIVFDNGDGTAGVAAELYGPEFIYSTYHCRFFVATTTECNPGVAPQQYSLTATRDNSDLGLTNVVHFGSVPSWYGHGTVTEVTGPGLPAGTGLLSFTTVNAPPLVVGDASLTTLVASLAGFEYVFTVTPDLFTNDGSANVGHTTAQMSITDFVGTGFRTDVWNVIAITVDTSSETRLGSLVDGSPLLSGGNSISVTINSNTNAQTAVIPNAPISDNELLGITSVDIACPVGLSPDPSTLNRTIPAWTIALGDFNFALPGQVAQENPPGTVEYAAVQIWRDQAIDFPTNREFFIGPKDEVIRPSKGAASGAFGTPTFSLDGGVSAFPKNSRGSAGVMTVTGKPVNYKPYPKRILE